MLIIIEGPDGVGKTTFAEQLASQFNAHIEHKGPPERPLTIEYTEPEFNPVDRHILDRWHLGELVYGPLVRHTTMLPWEFNLIEEFLRARGALVVLLTGDPDWLAERLAQKNEETSPQDAAKLYSACALFDGAFARSTLPKIRRISPVTAAFARYVADVAFLLENQAVNAMRGFYA